MVLPLTVPTTSPRRTTTATGIGSQLYTRHIVSTARKPPEAVNYGSGTQKAAAMVKEAGSTLRTTVQHRCANAKALREAKETGINTRLCRLCSVPCRGGPPTALLRSQGLRSENLTDFASRWLIRMTSTAISCGGNESSCLQFSCVCCCFATGWD